MILLTPHRSGAAGRDGRLAAPPGHYRGLLRNLLGWQGGSHPPVARLHWLGDVEPIQGNHTACGSFFPKSFRLLPSFCLRAPLACYQ